MDTTATLAETGGSVTGPDRVSGPGGLLLQLISASRARFSEMALLGLFANLLALALPIFVLQVYDRVIAHAGLTTLQGLVLGILVVLGFDLLLRESRSALLRFQALRIDVTLSQRLFDRILALPLQVQESRATADWQTLFRDIEAVRNVLAGAPALLILDMPFALLFLAFVFIIAPIIGGVLLLAIPAFILVGWLSGRALRRSVAAEQQAGIARDSVLHEILAARTSVKTLDLDNAVRTIWEARQAAGIAAAHRRGHQTDRFSAVSTLLANLTTLVLTTVGALAILDQQMSMGALVAGNMLAGRVIMPFNQLVSSWQGLVQAWMAAGRLATVLNQPPERVGSPLRQDRPAGRITLDGVGFRYAAGLPAVLDRLQVDILPGGLTGIIGRNGSGKSTLLRLIRGLYDPTTGRILLDGADIAQFSRRELARWVGYVPQETVFLSGSIRDAIAGGHPDTADAELLEAARRAGAHGFISALPAGYAAQIGEAGFRLSGGQRQRLAVARALVGDPPVLLLDEPTGNLDRQAEEELRLLLLDLARTRTVILVSHSQSLLSSCNNILVLEGGHVVAGGPATEILQKLNGGRPAGLSVVTPSAVPSRPG
jgi:ATP-binding cassette, subfamily C, bacterial LapB